MANEGMTAGGAAQNEGSVSVVWGLYNDDDNYVGKSIDNIRDELGGIWGIPADAVPYVNDDAVDNNYVLRDGDSLEFTRRSGEKG